MSCPLSSHALHTLYIFHLISDHLILDLFSLHDVQQRSLHALLGHCQLPLLRINNKAVSYKDLAKAGLHYTNYLWDTGGNFKPFRHRCDKGVPAQHFLDWVGLVAATTDLKPYTDSSVQQEERHLSLK